MWLLKYRAVHMNFIRALLVHVGTGHGTRLRRNWEPSLTSGPQGRLAVNAFKTRA